MGGQTVPILRRSFAVLRVVYAGNFPGRGHAEQLQDLLLLWAPLKREDLEGVELFELIVPPICREANEFNDRMSLSKIRPGTARFVVQLLDRTKHAVHDFV